MQCIYEFSSVWFHRWVLFFVRWRSSRTCCACAGYKVVEHWSGKGKSLTSFTVTSIRLRRERFFPNQNNSVEDDVADPGTRWAPSVDRAAPTGFTPPFITEYNMIFFLVIHAHFSSPENIYLVFASIKINCVKKRPAPGWFFFRRLRKRWAAA